MNREAITPCGEHTAAVSGSGRSVGRRGAVAPGSAWALVTGAGSGLGRCYALRLAALGYRLVIVGNNAAPLEALAGEIRRAAGANASASFPEVRVMPMDLARVGAAQE